MQASTMLQYDVELFIISGDITIDVRAYHYLQRIIVSVFV
jgi:hypothetical protein